MRDWETFGRPRPRPSKGGIKAQTQRGGFARSWWGMRWIQVLEDLDLEMRRGRGRSYARGGQVRSIDIDEGEIVATVQGSRVDPYRVTIRVKTLPALSWDAVAGAIAGKAVFAARLLAGEMPEGIEDIFTAAGLSLFPSRQDDLTMDCSCPDEASPCKHIAAVHYLVAEEFDRDPFLIFRLRGLSREDLSRLVLAKSAGAGVPAGADARRPDGGETGSAPAGEALAAGGEARAARGVTRATADDAAHAADEPLPASPRPFWGEIDVESPVTAEAVRIPAIPAPLVKRLGSFPFWRGEKNFLATIERIYGAASEVGMSVYLGDPDLGADVEES